MGLMDTFSRKRTGKPAVSVTSVGSAPRRTRPFVGLLG